MEKPKPEGAIRDHDSPAGGQHTRVAGAYGAATRMRKPAGRTR